MIRDLKAVLRAVVERFGRVSGRTLRPTRAGQMILVLALAVGFAAMNTGNNLLFFGWGLVLSSIVISGILSESTLRAAAAMPLPPDEARANALCTLPVSLENHRRVPAFGVAVSFMLGRSAADSARTGATFELRLSPGARRTAQVPWTPTRRGLHALQSLRVATAAPFGFFSKERIVPESALPVGLRTVLVLPQRIDTRALGRALWARLGDTPAGQAGAGDELFSLRPFRDGDDPRRIAWKRAAKTGRLVLREHEATRSRELMVAVRIGSGASEDDAEDAIATAGSLVEDLLQDGHAVGLRAAGLSVAPGRSHRQRLACLNGLATWEHRGDHPDGGAAPANAALIVVAVGAVDTADADVVVMPIARRRA